MRGSGRRLYTAVMTALAMAVVLNLVQLVQKVVFHEEQPQLFGWSGAVILSGSMEPAISTGDMVIIRHAESYEKGDVVMFDDGGIPVTHRIVDAAPDGFMTKGDANTAADRNHVPAERIIGRVEAVIPGIGNAALFLRRPAGFLLLTALIIVFLWGEDIAGLYNRKGRN